MFGNHTQQEVEKYIAEQAGVESVGEALGEPCAILLLPCLRRYRLLAVHQRPLT